MTGRRIVAIVVGALGLLVGVALVSGATTMLVEDRDANGFYLSDEFTFERSSHAIVSEDMDILTDAPAWLIDWITEPVDLRMQGTAPAGGSLFLGIAATDDVDAYLSGVAHHEVTDLSIDNRAIVDVTYEAHEGTLAPTAPALETIWVAQSEGAGTVTMDWELESGSWMAVVMNADGSAPVTADLAFGAKISNITAISWITMGIGSLLVLGFGYMLYRSSRRPRDLDETGDVVDLREKAGTPRSRTKEPVA